VGSFPRSFIDFFKKAFFFIGDKMPCFSFKALCQYKGVSGVGSERPAISSKGTKIFYS